MRLGLIASIAGLMAASCASAETRVHVGEVHASAIVPECTPVQSCIAECRATKESAMSAADVCREECGRLYDDVTECRNDCASCCANASGSPDPNAVACCPLGAGQTCDAFCTQRESARRDCLGVCDLVRARADETARGCIAGCGIALRPRAESPRQASR